MELKKFNTLYEEVSTFLSSDNKLSNDSANETSTDNV